MTDIGRILGEEVDYRDFLPYTKIIKTKSYKIRSAGRSFLDMHNEANNLLTLFLNRQARVRVIQSKNRLRAMVHPTT